MSESNSVAFKSERDLPQELIDQIVNELRHDLGALQRCSLTSGRFHLPAERLLFANVKVICGLHLREFDAGTSKSIINLLTSPRHLEMIKSLEIIHSTSKLKVDKELHLYDNEAQANFVYFLDSLNNLESLVLAAAPGHGTKQMTYWESIRPRIRLALTNLSKSPNLTRLELDSILSFPFPWLRNFTHLKVLKISGLYTLIGNDNSESQKETPHTEQAMQRNQVSYLHSLRYLIKCEGAKEGDLCSGLPLFLDNCVLHPFPTISLSDLRNLDITNLGEGTTGVNQLLKLCSSLESFKYRPPMQCKSAVALASLLPNFLRKGISNAAAWEPHSPRFVVDLSPLDRLRCLEVHVALSERGAGEERLSDFPWLIKLFKSISESTKSEHLEVVKIAMSVMLHSQPVNEFEPEPWRELRPVFLSFRKCKLLEIYIGAIRRPTVNAIRRVLRTELAELQSVLRTVSDTDIWYSSSGSDSDFDSDSGSDADS